jgi:hypothetical protein
MINISTQQLTSGIKIEIGIQVWRQLGIKMLSKRGSQQVYNTRFLNLKNG